MGIRALGLLFVATMRPLVCRCQLCLSGGIPRSDPSDGLGGEAARAIRRAGDSPVLAGLIVIVVRMDAHRLVP